MQYVDRSSNANENASKVASCAQRQVELFSYSASLWSEALESGAALTKICQQGNVSSFTTISPFSAAIPQHLLY